MKFKEYVSKIIGPGVISGAADDDPSGIATYSQGGAQFGLGVAWLVLFQYPLMTAIQEMRDAFMRSEEFLDLENGKKVKNMTSPETASNDLMKDAIQKATPEDLGKMQEMLQTWASSILGKKQN